MKLGLRTKLLLVSVVLIVLCAVASEAYIGASLDADLRARGVAPDVVEPTVAAMRRTVRLSAGIAVVVAIALSSLAAHFVARSVRALTKVARRLSAGELSARTRASGSDEVAELGRAMDSLAASLSSALSELRGERDLLGRVLNGMREGVLLLDKGGSVALTNPALREMLLLGPEAVGRRPLELVRSAELKELLDRVERSGKTEVGEVEVGELKPRTMLVHATALPDQGGTVVVFVDVTDVRRLERMGKEFVANVSHELRTPVTMILSAAETLGHSALQGADVADFAQIIQRNADRLHRLVEDLLDLSRLDSRQYRLTLDSIDLTEVVETIAGLYRDAAQKRQVSLRVELGATYLCADRRALEQVLSNLIDNALKYTSERSSVTVRSEDWEDAVRLSVSDTGPGIEARHLPRIFERFYRADAGRSRELGGTGLGLSIVKNLVEAMGGTVKATSEPGRGSTFTVTLPREETVPSDPPPRV